MSDDIDLNDGVDGDAEFPIWLHEEYLQDCNKECEEVKAKHGVLSDEYTDVVLHRNEVRGHLALRKKGIKLIENIRKKLEAAEKAQGELL